MSAVLTARTQLSSIAERLISAAPPEPYESARPTKSTSIIISDTASSPDIYVRRLPHPRFAQFDTYLDKELSESAIMSQRLKNLGLSRRFIDPFLDASRPPSIYAEIADDGLEPIWQRLLLPTANSILGLVGLTILSMWEKEGKWNLAGWEDEYKLAATRLVGLRVVSQEPTMPGKITPDIVALFMDSSLEPVPSKPDNHIPLSVTKASAAQPKDMVKFSTLDAKSSRVYLYHAQSGTSRDDLIDSMLPREGICSFATLSNAVKNTDNLGAVEMMSQVSCYCFLFSFLKALDTDGDTGP